MHIDPGATDSLATGVRGTAFVVFGGEIGAMLIDMRWAVLLLVLLIAADFRLGWGESRLRHARARRAGDRDMMERTRWHKSRGVRRSLCKLADYVVVMLMLGAVGMAVFEPLGVSHTWGAWAGAVLACWCELSSILGHLFYLRGMSVDRRSVRGFARSLAVALVRRRSNDAAEALDEALAKADGRQPQQRGRQQQGKEQQPPQQQRRDNDKKKTRTT